MLKRFFAILLLALGFVLPVSVSAANYVIQYGDTLTSIARRFNTTVDTLVSVNSIQNADRIYAGDVLDVESEEPVIGAGYTPVTGYQSRTTSYIAANATTIPVASTRDKAGNQIVLSDISASSTVRVYMSLATGTAKEEILYCTGVTASSWTGCVRGLSFQGGDATASSTLAFAHNAGTSIIITDVGQFFSEFVDVSSSQTIFGTKTFNTFPQVTSTTAVPSSANQLASKYYVDNVGAGGFTASNVSSTGGIAVSTAGVPACPGAAACISLYASSTGGLLLESNGRVYLNTSSTAGISLDPLGRLYVDQSDNFNFTGTVTTTGALRVQTPTQAQDAVNLAYYQNQTVFFTATSTAAQAITAGQALFVTVTSTANPTDTGSNTSTFSFVGFATASASAAAQVTYTRPGGINCNQSGLTPSANYYLNGSSGAISTTPASSRSARVGIALTANCIQVLPPKYRLTGTVSTGAASNGSTFRVSTAFYPANISTVGGVDGDYSMFASNDAGSAWTFSMNTGSSGRVRNTEGVFYGLDETGGCLWRGNVSRDLYGVTVTNNNYAGAGCGNMLNTAIYYSISNE